MSEMKFIIKELDNSLVKDIYRVDNEFVIDARLVLRLEDNQLGYKAAAVPAYTKRYPPDEFDPKTYLDNLGKTAFLAYVDGQVAGQIMLHCNWNRFALIGDIEVDKEFRRMGIGRALLSHGEEWARKSSLPGMMVETQDTNVSACLFYESCGFVLKGFDTGLYAAADLYRDEIALFWYLNFDKDTPTT